MTPYCCCKIHLQTSDDDGGDRPRDQHHAPENSPAADLAVQQKGNAHSQNQLDADRKENKHQSMEKIGEKFTFLEQGNIVF